MNLLPLRDAHQNWGAQFIDLNGLEIPNHYGDILREHAALQDAAGVIDLSFRGRLCLTGADRQRFLHGQVTNDVNALKNGRGCYAALVTSKAKMVADLNIYLLENEILLDFEPGLTDTVTQRLEKYLIADDVQIVDAAPHYGLLSVQGPKAVEVIQRLELGIGIPDQLHNFSKANFQSAGEIYLANSPRTGTRGFDLYVPTTALLTIAERLVQSAKSSGGGICGWQALEIARVEAGIPRFGADMDDSTLPPEAGLEAGAISYTKGCYIGQEVIARIRTYGHVNRSLRGLLLAEELSALPNRNDKLIKDGKEAGFITSAVESLRLKRKIALACVRREFSESGTQLFLRMAGGETAAQVVDLPFAVTAFQNGT